MKLKIFKQLRNVDNTTWLKISIIIGILLSIFIYCSLAIKISKIKKEHDKKVSMLNDKIFELQMALLDKVDYQKTKDDYEKKSDTNRTVSIIRIDSLLSRYYY